MFGLCFGERVCELIRRLNVMNFELMLLKLVSYKMKINGNMFHPTMKD